MRLRIYLVIFEIVLVVVMFRLMSAMQSYWPAAILPIIILIDFIIVAVFNRQFRKHKTALHLLRSKNIINSNAPPPKADPNTEGPDFSGDNATGTDG